MLQESRAAGMEKVVLFIVAASGPKAAPNISDRRVCMGGVYSEACVCVCVCVVAAPHFAAVHRYHFVYEVKNWTEAQRHCREKFTDLAIVEDMEDVDALIRLADLSQMVYPSYSQRAWIGLYDTKNIWMWSLADRDFYRNWETEFRNWGSGYPNSFGKYVYCVRMDSAGRWSDGTCGVSLDVICSDVKGRNICLHQHHHELDECSELLQGTPHRPGQREEHVGEPERDEVDTCRPGSLDWSLQRVVEVGEWKNTHIYVLVINQTRWSDL
nr:L-selectin isoform X3 [Nothobranchius furzeri]